MRTFRIPDAQPLDFIVCGQLISNDEFLHMKRTLNENVFILVQEGTLFINAKDKQYQVAKNQFIFLKAGEEHFGFRKSEGFLSYFWVHFSDEAFEVKDSENSSYIFKEYGAVENYSRLVLLFRQMMDFSLEKDKENKKMLDYSLSLFMMELSRNFRKSDSVQTKNTNPVVNDVCNWIKLNFNKDFSLDEMAEEFNLQSTYLSKLFKKNMGKTIVQYVTEIRLTAAKNLLPNFSVKETAYSCGFSDEKYFMKLFKKVEGITPTQYKQAFSLRNVNQ